MNDWPRSDRGREEDRQQALKYSALMYSSPELLRGEPSSADLWWSFGIFCYQVLCGMAPFPDESVHNIFQLMNPTFTFNIPPFLEGSARDLLQQLLHPSLEQRLCKVQLIKKHPFFASVQWLTVANHTKSLPQPTEETNFQLSTTVAPSGALIGRPGGSRSVEDSIRMGQPLDTLIAPALKDGWAGLTHAFEKP